MKELGDVMQPNLSCLTVLLLLSPIVNAAVISSGSLRVELSDDNGAMTVTTCGPNKPGARRGLRTIRPAASASRRWTKPSGN